MNSNLLSELEARCEKLERRLKLTVLFAALAVGSIFMMGQTSRPKVLEASAFVLVDDAGRNRAQLAVRKDGTAELLLSHSDGVSSATVTLGPDGAPAVRMKTPRKTAAIEISPDGPAAIRITETYAKSAVEMLVDASGKPTVTVRDPQGKAAFHAP